MNKVGKMMCLVIIFVLIMHLSIQAQVLNVPEGVGVKDFGRFIGEKDIESGISNAYLHLNNGELWTVKINWHHDLINNNGTIYELSPTATYETRKIADNVKKVSTMGKDTMAQPNPYDVFFIKTDNTLWGFGSNKNYTLGLGHNNSVENPIKIIDNVKDVYPQQTACYVLKNDNTIWGWGENNWYSFGLGKDSEIKDGFKAYGSPIKLFENIKYFYAGGIANRYITLNNELFGVGALGGHRSSEITQYESMPILLLTNVDYMKFGNYGTSYMQGFDYYNFVKLDGTVWGYDRTSYDKNLKNFYRNPIQLQTSSKELEADASYYHFYDENHGLWIKANSDALIESAVLGADIKQGITQPIKILDNVKVVFDDGNDIVFSGALTYDGDFYAWGNSQNAYKFNAKFFVLDENNNEIKYKTPVKVLESVDELYQIGSYYFYKTFDGDLYYCHNTYCSFNNRDLFRSGVELKTEYIQLVSGGKQNNKPSEIKVTFAGKPLNFNVPVLNKSSRTMYPFRELLEAVGAEVSWDGTTNTAIGILGDNKVEFTINSNSYKINGEVKEMEKEVTAFIENGRTYIPIRYAVEGLGFTVDWDENTRTINVK